MGVRRGGGEKVALWHSGRTMANCADDVRRCGSEGPTKMHTPTGFVVELLLLPSFILSGFCSPDPALGRA